LTRFVENIGVIGFPDALRPISDALKSGYDALCVISDALNFVSDALTFADDDLENSAHLTDSDNSCVTLLLRKMGSTLHLRA
jgi:hypothetical protein